jgi:hypothetical protein
MHYWTIVATYQGVEQTPNDRLFASPFQAETAVEELRRRRSSAYTFRTRLATWKEREKAMFTTGVYQEPVWAQEEFWRAWGSYFREHFTHVSLMDPQSIAFTEDATKGEADRQTHMRPGKYLQKFLGAGPDGRIEHGPLAGHEAKVTKQKIAFYAAWHRAGARPPNDDVLEFTDDPDMMVELYENGPDSCMMGKHWAKESHPVRVYAGGGLKLAYMMSACGTKVVGRSLCWPDKAVFGRVYPTPNGPTDRERYDELMARLKGLGWTSVDEDNSVFEGALLSQLSDRYGNFIMPYLDHSYGVEEVYREGKTWWRMTHDTHHQENTDGTYLDGEDRIDWTCDCCDEGFTEDTESCTVYTSWRANRDGGRRGGWPAGERQWCEYCRDQNTFYCEGSDEYYQDSCDSIEVGYTTYNRQWFLANDGWQCSHSEEYFFRIDDKPVTLATGELVHPDNLEDAAFQCLWDGQWWPKDYESEVVPGYSSSCDVATVHPCEMEHVFPPVHGETVMAAWAQSHALPDLHMASVLPPVRVDISHFSNAANIRPIPVIDGIIQLSA